MQSKVKKFLCLTLALLMTTSIAACGGAGGGTSSSSGNGGGYSSSVGGGDSSSSSRPADSSITSQETPRLENGMPNYDAITGVEPLMLNSYFSPELDKQAFQTYKDCGFNWIMLGGDFWFPSNSVETALGWCDELGINALVNVSGSETMMRQMAPTYKQYSSFKGYYFDEPFMDMHGTKNGLIQLEGITQDLVSTHPDVSFSVNLNPTWFIDTFSQPYTYEEYVNAMMEKINRQYQNANSRAYKWIGADDYPFWINGSTKYLDDGWLEGLAYLAQAKKESDMDNVVSNFFIQAMPFGVGTKSRNRVMTYKEMKMQMYTLMAFGYDSMSFFCYASPPVVNGGEFTASQKGLVDREGNKTAAWTDAQKLMREVNKFQHTYMQFNDGWSGVYPVLGSSSSSSRSDFNKLNNFAAENLGSPVIRSMIMRLMGLTSVTSTRDALVGCFKDDYDNSGFVVVNYNDTDKNYTSSVDMQFDATKYSKAWVYIDGVQDEVQLASGKLTLQLDVGEGVFVIPIKNQ